MSSVFKNGNLYWRQTYHNGKSFRHSLKTSDKQEARMICARMDEEERSGPDKEYSCATAISHYIENLKTRCSQEYITSTKRRLESICVSTPILNHLTEQIIQDHIKLCKSKYDANNSISAVKAWLKWCVRNSYIKTNPAEWVKKIPVQEKTRHPFPHKLIPKIIKAAEPETIYPLVMLALYTGMRRAELFRLRWEDIDLKAGHVTVKISKAKKVRVIPLAKPLKAVLASYKAKEGPICDMHNHRRILDRIMRKSGATGGWHNFRHTFATESLRSGADLQTVCDLCGHSSPSVTARYLASTPTHHADAVNRLKF